MALDEHMRNAIDKMGPVGRESLAAAFRRLTFVYGTTGTGSFLGQMAKIFNEKRLKQQTDLTFYDPGPRTAITLEPTSLMMDNYYGAEGTIMHERRDPVIGDYVHRAMRFKDAYDQSVPGWKAYKQTYPQPQEHHGWQWPNTKDATTCYFFRTLPGGGSEPLKGTQYMSWAIQMGIMEFGGTLVFEGTMVYYNQVFLQNPARMGDTDLEAVNLFKYFKPGNSRAKFGDNNATVIFHWAGKEAIPTQFKFQENWVWSGAYTHTSMNWRTAEQIETEVMRPIWNNFLYKVPGDKFCATSKELLDRDRELAAKEKKQHKAETQKNASSSYAGRLRERLAAAKALGLEGDARTAFLTAEAARQAAEAKEANAARNREDLITARRRAAAHDVTKRSELERNVLAAEAQERAGGMLPLDGIIRQVG